MPASQRLYVNGQPVRLLPSKAIGKGGEADVYDIDGGKVLKVFKAPNHPDLQMEPDGPEKARQRIAEQQQKLHRFPKGLPDRVIAPEGLATESAQGGQILGYTMRYLKGAEVLLRYADSDFRTKGGLANSIIGPLFRDLHATVTSLHRTGTVIGDFNDLNVMVADNDKAFLIDADSFQFPPFLCRAFTARFVDPLLCDPKKDHPELIRPHTKDSDWFAYSIMLMQCLLFINPYFGGMYKPKDKAKRIKHEARSLKRITVFHPEVGYPGPNKAKHYGILPDDLLQAFHRIFEKDQRGAFPLPLIESMRWTVCSTCGLEHARAKCPVCFQAAPGSVRETVQVKGAVTANRFFRTAGTILYSTVQNGVLRYLYHENGEFKRENGLAVAPGSLNPNLRFRIQGDTTLIGATGQVLQLEPGKAPEKIAVDSFGRLPVFDANADSIYWMQAGQLYKTGEYAPGYLGDGLANQTLFWVGASFGFGFYRAGHLSVAFTFNAKRRGINDSIKLPPINGQLFDSTCFFSHDRCWFLVSIQENGKIMNRCYVIDPNGSVLASAEAEAGDGSWLGAGLRGKCAVGQLLFAPTDSGIARIEVDGTAIAATKVFTETEPFVDASTRLFPGKNGLYAVGRQEIQLITMR